MPDGRIEFTIQQRHFLFFWWWVDAWVNNDVYIVIDQDMHSYESILGIYDTFEGAMNCNAWSNRGIVPNQNGEGGSLFIYKEYVNKELSPKY